MESKTKVQPKKEAMTKPVHTQRETFLDLDCDFCSQNKKITVAMYDAKTSAGPWAYMCEEHFKKYGIGLGLGKGQKLYRKKDYE